MIKRKNTIIFGLNVLFDKSEFAKKFETAKYNIITNQYNGMALLSEMDKINIAAKLATLKSINIKKDAVDFIKLLNDLGFSMAIAAINADKIGNNLITIHNQTVKNVCDLYRYFSVIITKNDLNSATDNIYMRTLEALKPLNKSQSECIVIENSIEDAEDAAKAGFDVVLLGDIEFAHDNDNIQLIPDFDGLKSCILKM